MATEEKVGKVKEEEINKGTIEELDKLIGKPFNNVRNDECNSKDKR